MANSELVEGALRYRSRPASRLYTAVTNTNHRITASTSQSTAVSMIQSTAASKIRFTAIARRPLCRFHTTRPANSITRSRCILQENSSITLQQLYLHQYLLSINKGIATQRCKPPSLSLATAVTTSVDGPMRTQEWSRIKPLRLALLRHSRESSPTSTHITTVLRGRSSRTPLRIPPGEPTRKLKARRRA